MKALILLIILLLAAPAAAMDKSEIFLISGGAADYCSTFCWPDRSGFQERNSWASNDRLQAALVKTAGVAATMLLTRWLKQRGHPKAAKWTNYFLGSVQFTFAIKNTHLHLTQ